MYTNNPNREPTSVPSLTAPLNVVRDPVRGLDDDDLAEFVADDREADLVTLIEPDVTGTTARPVIE